MQARSSAFLHKVVGTKRIAQRAFRHIFVDMGLPLDDSAMGKQ